MKTHTLLTVFSGLFTILRVYSINQCEGHYGPGGDDATLSDPDLRWCCTDCNCKDLGDRLHDDECGSGDLQCPGHTKQIGELNTDIGGCGLEGCDARYQDSYPTIQSCKESCRHRSDCRTFTWAPMDGDKNHAGKSVCTLYNTVEPNQVWGPKQIMCRLLKCPLFSSQIGEINADISGCGLEGCDARYQDSYPTINSCHDGCVNRGDCKSFTFAPLGGDQNHVDKSVCTLYDDITPNQPWGPMQIMCRPLVCPDGSTQAGDLNADIGGCGLDGCDARYDYPDIESCEAECVNRDNCASFSWAPLSGDKNHPGVRACTLYDTATPTGTWGAEQIMCAPNGGASVFVLDFSNGNVVHYSLYVVMVLLIVNLVCLTVSCYNERDQRVKYKVVSIQSDTDV